MESENGLHENSPLIAKQPSPGVSGNSRYQNRVLLTAYLVIIFIMFGDYMQQSPKIQIYESILCSDYYSKADNRLMQGRDCKVKAVQQELATLRGVERLTELLPSMSLRVVFFRSAYQATFLMTSGSCACYSIWNCRQEIRAPNNTDLRMLGDSLCTDMDTIRL